MHAALDGVRVAGGWLADGIRAEVGGVRWRGGGIGAVRWGGGVGRIFFSAARGGREGGRMFFIASIAGFDRRWRA